MNICMVGAGKLGLPVALAIESKGHTVTLVDKDPQGRVARALATRTFPEQEMQAESLLQGSTVRLVSLADGVAAADIVFIAVETPHDARYEGVTPMPSTRADFSYTALVQACTEVSMALQRPTPVAVISTVLPGTMDREVLPRVSRERFQLVYNPSFIAMGSVVRDFLHPEFTLLGVATPDPAYILRTFYESIHNRTIYACSVREAELIKVAYNTFITQKIVFANALMEICHKVGANVDAVTDGLALGVQRLLSPAYLAGGMGDGGGCHPRDNIALSWLAQQLSLSADIFTDVMRARERQSAWLADLTLEQAGQRPVILLGAEFKRNSLLQTGSAARLLDYQLRERGCAPVIVSPEKPARPAGAGLFVVTCNHDTWHDFPFQAGDTVLDPWREYRAAVVARGADYIGIGAGA